MKIFYRNAVTPSQPKHTHLRKVPVAKEIVEASLHHPVGQKASTYAAVIFEV